MPSDGVPEVVVVLFAAAREAAGAGSMTVTGRTVGDVLAAACAQAPGPELAAVLESCRVWRNGDPAAPDDPVASGDEVAVLPPVSGG